VAAGVAASLLLVAVGGAHVARRKMKQRSEVAHDDPDNADKLNGIGSDAGTIEHQEGDVELL